MFLNRHDFFKMNIYFEIEELLFNQITKKIEKQLFGVL